MVISAKIGELMRGELPEWLRNIDATWSLRKCFESLPLHANLKCTPLFSKQMNTESCQYKSATRSSLEGH